MPGAIIVGTDLMFTAKVTGTARALGIDAAAAPSPSALAAHLDAGQVRLVMVDMALLDAVAALRIAVDHPARPATVAFYSHVQSALAAAARSAGAQSVMPRSQFSEQLPALLQLHLGPAGPATA